MNEFGISSPRTPSFRAGPEILMDNLMSLGSALLRLHSYIVSAHVLFSVNFTVSGALPFVRDLYKIKSLGKTGLDKKFNEFLHLPAKRRLFTRKHKVFFPVPILGL